MDLTNLPEIKTSNSVASANAEEAVAHALRDTKGYVTLPRLAQMTGLSFDVVQKAVEEHPEKVRKSKIETDDGAPLYTLNTPLSGLADAWNSFRYLNAKKF